MEGIRDTVSKHQQEGKKGIRKKPWVIADSGLHTL